MYNRKEMDRLYRLSHKKERKRYSKIFKRTHKDYYKKYGKLYRKKNKKRLKLYAKRYRQKNRKILSEYQRKRQEFRRHTDISFRIKINLRNRIYQALTGYLKSENTMKLIGCSIDELKLHLQRRFTKGMSWKNYGEWHIDHIRPCASFDLRKKSEQFKCFNYSNLRPLWAKENRLKGAK